MESSSARADRLQGLAMIAVLALGLWQGVAALLTPAAQRQFDGKLTSDAVLAGRTAAAVNTIMAHDLPTDHLWRGIGGVLRYRLFNSGGPQVWVGDQGWLYLTEELRPWPDADANMTRRARIVHDVAARLQAKGIGLLVALVPDKARIAAETLGSAPRAQQTLARYSTFASQLKRQGIAVVELDDVLAKANVPVFWRTDTHWNEYGAALAAAAIARANAMRFAESSDFQTTADAALTEGPGDLLRLMSLDLLSSDWAPLLRPQPDLQHLEHTISLAASADASSLLDDAPVIPVVLIGSSFSLNANFAGRLQQSLHAQVTNVAKLGGGFAGAAQNYFTGPLFRETPPKLVVWEIPERVVGQDPVEADRLLSAWAERAGGLAE